jgi:predicted signal transduction protein with EAL and GGDEF domain
LFVLRELGCDLVQGWHLGRPMTADAFEELIPVRIPADPDDPEDSHDAVVSGPSTHPV